MVIPIRPNSINVGRNLNEISMGRDILGYFNRLGECAVKILEYDRELEVFYIKWRLEFLFFLII